MLLILIISFYQFSCSSDSSNPVNPVSLFSATPIEDITAPVKYFSEDGGLYGNWINEVPQTHRLNAISELSKIAPLNVNGDTSRDGKIVMISIGMSNTFYSFGAFDSLANLDPAKSTVVELVNGARVGNDAVDWATNDKQSWEHVEGKLNLEGFTPLQVQVAWIYLAYRDPIEGFPTATEKLEDYIQTVLNILITRFPNVKIAYLTSREYAGYSGTGASNPEPYAYESAFACRWLIERQINGDTELNYNAASGEVKSPLIIWGPYTWASGTTPRSDGLTWLRNDFGDDGMHPSSQGYTKIGNLMLDFFKNNELAKSWYNQP